MTKRNQEGQTVFRWLYIDNNCKALVKNSIDNDASYLGKQKYYYYWLLTVCSAIFGKTDLYTLDAAYKYRLA